jgi:acetate kinase
MDAEAFASIEDALEALFKKLPPIDRIGHRIVHGGQLFSESVRMDAEVKRQLRTLLELAPLHNLAELELVDLVEQKFPHVPQYALFDTAFHRSLPQEAQVYPGPYAWYAEGIRRYGFHGISFQYCTRRVETLLGGACKKMVVCHLGSGASLCAVKEGKSVDTTMGFTPLEGLMMDTRSGSVDPGILLHLQKRGEDLSHVLYFESGLLGLSGSSSDMRDILQKSEEGEARAKLALEVYVHRLVRELGGMVASLSGMDALVFTAGIGENAPQIREKVCAAFSFLGVKIDSNKNRIEDGDRLVSVSDSRVKVLVIHTQESFEIARQCFLKE